MITGLVSTLTLLLLFAVWTFVSDAPVQATTSDLAVFAEEGSTSAVAQNPAQGIDTQLPILARYIFNCRC